MQKMSNVISADAVPIEGLDKPNTLELTTQPAFDAPTPNHIEEYCCERMENININNSDIDSEESLHIVEPMAESSDSNDGNDSELRVTQYQGGRNGQKNEERSRQAPIQNQIIIQNPTGVVHLGPTYNINVGQAFTQVNTNKNSNNTNPSQSTSSNNEIDENVPSKEFMRPLWYSNRVIDSNELLRLSKNIGSNWKSVGNGLKFNWSQLDQFESDTHTLGDAVHRMLYRWLQWKDQKATVGRLTKVLFNHKEYEAIRCLSP